jgi:hypothetical protein
MLFERPYLENTHHNKRAGGVAQGVGPEFKPQYHTHIPHTHTHKLRFFRFGYFIYLLTYFGDTLKE